MRLSAFILPEIQNITAKDDMELEKMGERKQAVFAIIPDNDGTFVRPDRAPCNAEKWYCPA